MTDHFSGEFNIEIGDRFILMEHKASGTLYLFKIVNKDGKLLLRRAKIEQDEEE